MNIMKKKPELFNKTGKSSIALRNFLNNLKENDLHYENKQITQCVFLGVLRLKPVPSIFSHNVPSVSTTVVDSDKSKRIKNSTTTKELIQNDSTKDDINKVLSGKISKKNPQKIKAAVKNVPTRKPNIKIKLNTKKKVNNDSEASVSSDKQEAVISDASKKGNTDSVIAETTITLNPITSPTKFNPVQNLFDKLKQRIDDSHNEPGPSRTSTLSNNSTDRYKSPVKYSICKINASRQSNINIYNNKTLKRQLQKKSSDLIPFSLISTSPITISDTESNGKKDNDDVILLDDNTTSEKHSHDQNIVVEDVIIINDAPKPKRKERVSPRHKVAVSNLTEVQNKVTDKETLTVLANGNKLRSANDITVDIDLNIEPHSITESRDIIIISDEPIQTRKSKDSNVTCSEGHNNEINDIIVIDEVKEVRVSPRHKRTEENALETSASPKNKMQDEVIVLTDEKQRTNVNKIIEIDSSDITKTQQLSINVDSQQKNSKKEAFSPRLLKMVDTDKRKSQTIKKESNESDVTIVNEKPKRRKNSLMLPTLLPPMLLNAPMLLRSEMAQKKSNYTPIDKPRTRKSREKIKDAKSVNISTGHVKTNSKNKSLKLSNSNSEVLILDDEPMAAHQECSSSSSAIRTVDSGKNNMQQNVISQQEICQNDALKNKPTKQVPSIKKLHLLQNNAKVHIEHNKDLEKNTESKIVQEASSPPQLIQNQSPKNNIIVLSEDEPVTEANQKVNAVDKAKKTKIFRKSVPEGSTHNDDEVIVIKEEENWNENVSPRLLRSDLSKQRMLKDLEVNEKSKSYENSQILCLEKSLSEANDSINLSHDSESNRRVSPRTHRSNLIEEKSPTNQKPLVEEVTLIIHDKIPRKEKPSSSQKPKRTPKHVDLDEIITVSERRAKKQRDRSSGRLLRSELAQIKAKEKLSQNTEVEEVVVLIHEEPKPKSPIELSCSSTEDVCEVVVPDGNKSIQTDEHSPRILRSDLRKLNPELTSPKTEVKLENKPLPDTPMNEVPNDVQAVTQKCSKKPPEGISAQELSPRLLRSEMMRKEVSENLHNNIILSPRVLRSEICPIRKSSQNAAKEKSLCPKVTEKKKSQLKRVDVQINSTINSQETSNKIGTIHNQIPDNQTFECVIVSESPDCTNATENNGYFSAASKKRHNFTNNNTQVSSISKKIMKSKKKRNRKSKITLLSSKTKLKTPMLLRSELAQKKNVANNISINKQVMLSEMDVSNEVPKKLTRSQLKNNSCSELVEDANLSMEFVNPQKKKKSSKAKSTLENNSIQNLPLKSAEIHLNAVSSVDNITPEQNEENVMFSIDHPELQTVDADQIINNAVITQVPVISPIVLQKDKSVKNKLRKNLETPTRLKRTCTIEVKDEPINNIIALDENSVAEENMNLNSKSFKNNRSSNRLKKHSSELNIKESTEATIPAEVPVTLKGNGNVKNKTKKSKSTTLLNKNTTESSIDADVVIATKNISPKRNSSQSRKTANKSKQEIKLEDERTPEKTGEVQNEQFQIVVKKSEVCNNTMKGDITVFDFDESEPEVVPLRLNSTPRKSKINRELQQLTSTKRTITPNAKKQNASDEAVTKAQAKAKLLSIFNEKLLQATIDAVATNSNMETSGTPKLPKKKIITNQVVDEQRSHSNNEINTDDKNKRKSSSNPNKNSTPLGKQAEVTSNKTTKTSTSPLKQTTITDMFNKVMLKREKALQAASVDSIFQSSPKEKQSEPMVNNNSENIDNDMPPPKLEMKPQLLPNHEGEDEDDPYGDDSDCDSRMEWIPEEYAEYKFKYSAKKMMSYRPIHKCKICLLILPTYYKLSKHKEEHSKKANPYICKQCDQNFSKIDDLTAHLRLHKGKHPYTCKKCDAGFWTRKALDAHTPIHVLKKVKQPNKRFRCDVCAKEFSKLCDMERHTRVHTGEKPCICNICNKRFQQSHNLSKHLLTHLHVKPFHCDICNKQFGRNDVLNRHLLTHSVEKPINCPLCPKGFIRQTQLNNHMKKSHPDAGKITATTENNV